MLDAAAKGASTAIMLVICLAVSLIYCFSFLVAIGLFVMLGCSIACCQGRLNCHYAGKIFGCFLIDCCIGLFDILGCLAAPKGASTAIMLVYQLQMIAPSN